MLAALLMPPACVCDEAARGSVAAVDQTTGALQSAELLSINGSYGDGCADRSGPWSLEVLGDATLDHPRLSVMLNNDACALTLTAQQTSDGLITADPAILLTTSYKLTPSAFGDPIAFYANASLSSVSFAGDFVITVLHSDDPSLETRANTARALAPTVIVNTPLGGATGVSIATKPTATFSTAMDPATITDLTFTVTQGLMPVAGTVTFDALTDTASFTPDAVLGLGLLYEATVTTGAEDLGSTPLAADHVWSFTTAASSQAPIDLRSASGFVVLAGSTVTSTGLTEITGDLGVSPGTAVTGFGPGVLFGNLHAGDPTAADAIADLSDAYNDAAGRMLDPILVTGNLGGQTLSPGLYKSLTSLEVSSGDLTFDALGDSAAVFIFQMATTWVMATGLQIILTNGAEAANIYFQVGSSATLGTYTVFHGTIMADQSITLATGATVNGRVLARIAAVTMDTNTIVGP
jgi:hypothetical protein